MPKPVYINLSELNDLQTHIMSFVDFWVRQEKTPVPQKQILTKMKSEGIKDATVIKSLGVLLKKGYIRRAAIISNKTYYVQLKTL